MFNIYKNVVLKKCLFVVNYHRINVDSSLKNEFDDGVLGPNPEDFEKQLIWLKKNSDIVSEKDVLESLYTSRNLPKRSSMITFDDGYIDNFTSAYHLLRNNNVPAIFFIPTKNIEERRLGWWDQIAYCLKKTKENTIFFQGKTLNPHIKYFEAFDYIVSFIDYGKLSIENLIRELFLVCKVDAPSIESQDKHLMTWSNLKEMVSGNMTIGTHTHSHRILAHCSYEEQIEEIRSSKEIAESNIGCRILSMAYPVGGKRHFNYDSKKIAQESGYELCFSFYGGRNKTMNYDKYDMRRLEGSPTFSEFAKSIFINSR